MGPRKSWAQHISYESPEQERAAVLQPDIEKENCNCRAMGWLHTAGGLTYHTDQLRLRTLSCAMTCNN